MKKKIVKGLSKYEHAINHKLKNRKKFTHLMNIYMGRSISDWLQGLNNA